jgi:hypothetical protein
MELHRPKSERKKWSHYFFEFFMLFLAITLGFYAENRREHYIEHIREKQYMRMLIQDLESDIRRIDSNRLNRLGREAMLGRLITLLEEKELSKAQEIYRLADSTDGYENFQRNDRTIIQFRNAGGMRMIREDTVSTAIMDYDAYILSESESNERVEEERIDRYKAIRFRLFDTWCYLRFTSGDMTTPLKFLPADLTTRNEIAGSLFQVKRISETSRETGEAVKAKAMALINLIREEYHSLRK